jgi:hypothetical protein
MSRSDRFQQHEDEIAGLTGNTPNFDTDAEGWAPARSMQRLIEDLQEAMTLRDVAQKHAPEELAQHGADEKMVFGKWMKTSKGMRKRIKRQAAAEKPKFKVMRSPKGILAKVPAAQRHASTGLARAFGEGQDYAGMRALIEGLQRVMEEKETYLVIKKGKDGTLFLTGTKWSPEYPDAMIFNTISKAEKAAKQYGGEALSKTDFDEDNY